jgi:starch synthase
MLSFRVIALLRVAVKVLFVSFETYPLAKTGGLADVSAALPKALARLGVDIRLVVPGYPNALRVAAEQRKSRCKEELRRELGLASAPQVPLLAWVSRITHQKLLDTVLEVLPALLDCDMQLALIGQGEADAERALVDHAIASRAKAAVRIGYDESLAHRFYAAGESAVAPAALRTLRLRRALCDALRAVPIVRRVGGLLDNVVAATDDTIRNGTATGFTFQDANVSALLDCVDRALAAYAQPLVWRTIQRQAMRHDSS